MTDNALIVSTPDLLVIAGQIANDFAAANVLAEYRDGLTANTLRRQASDLALFERFLREGKISVRNLSSNVECWRGVTHGLIKAFVNWQMAQGYAIGSVNVRLATIKSYCKLAHRSGVISADEYTLIQTVKGYGFNKGKNVDEKREIKRTGPKKPSAVSINRDQVKFLKLEHPDTPQGRRDALLMCLLLDQGLRCGEVALLKAQDFNLIDGTFSFYRPKVKKQQTNNMTPDTLRAATAYITQDVPALANKLLQGSLKGGRLAGGMSERAINQRVGALGRAVGLPKLSPHDCRHSWATRAARKSDLKTLQDSGGWNSPAMPMRYVASALIANEGLVLE